MSQAGLELTTSCLLEWSLSEFCHTDSCFPSVETRVYKNKLLFIYGPRSLLSCCTVLSNGSLVVPNGIVKDVMNSQAEIALASLSMLYNRYLAIDFLHPIYKNPRFIFVKKDLSKV